MISIPPAARVVSVLRQSPRASLMFGHSLIDSHKFWKGIWGVFGGALLLCVLLNAGLFFAYTRPSGQSASVSTFMPGHDPFSSKLRGESFTVVSNELYQDSLPINFNAWSWEATADWRSSAARHEGPYALEMNFAAPGGTVGMNGALLDLTQYQSVSLWVRPTDTVGDLYLSLYNAKGASVGMQSLAWYAPDATLVPNTWQMIKVPLANLVPAGTKTISGFSISSQNAGTAFADSIQLQKEQVEHLVWVAPPTPAGGQATSFAAVVPASLPYNLSFTQSALSAWQNYYGTFALAGGGLAVGPSAQNGTTGSMSALLSGRNWSDYTVETNINWGDTSTYALLVRVVDDKNFVSCSFSDAGVFVQMYKVTNGTSELIGQRQRLSGSDTLAAQVQGSTVECLVGGEKAILQEVSGIASTGTVGIETWNDTTGTSPHIIRSLSVTPVVGE